MTCYLQLVRDFDVIVVSILRECATAIRWLSWLIVAERDTGRSVNVSAYARVVAIPARGATAMRAIGDAVDEHQPACPIGNGEQGPEQRHRQPHALARGVDLGPAAGSGLLEAHPCRAACGGAVHEPRLGVV